MAVSIKMTIERRLDVQTYAKIAATRTPARLIAAIAPSQALPRDAKENMSVAFRGRVALKRCLGHIFHLVFKGYVDP